jgi:hypothetical protein
MNKYGGSGGIAPQFLTSVLDGGEWSASHPCRFTPGERFPGTHWIGGWVGPRAGLDGTKKRKIFCSCRKSNPDRSPRNPSLYRLIYPGPHISNNIWISNQRLNGTGLLHSHKIFNLLEKIEYKCMGTVYGRFRTGDRRILFALLIIQLFYSSPKLIYLLVEMAGVARDSMRNEETREIHYGIIKENIICKGFYPRYSLDRRLGGPQNRSRSCGEEKHLAPAGNPTPAVRPVETPRTQEW